MLANAHPPLTAFRRQDNLRSLIIRAKVPEQAKPYPVRKLKGMHKCGKSCTACPYIMTTKTIKIDNREFWSINKKVSCETSNVIYMIECQKNGCKEKRYIGETKRP